MNPQKYIAVLTGIVVLIAIGLILSSSNGSSPSPEQEQIFEQANQHYQEQQYLEAITKYRELLNQDVNGAHIHNNLASSYQRMGDVGRSILHFEKAIQLDHYDSDIRNNLNKARQNSATYEDTELSNWQKIIATFSSTHWVVLASLALLGLTGGLVLKFMGYIKPSIKLQVFTALAVVGLITLSIFAVKTQQDNLQNKAIVLIKNTNLRISPFQNADQIVVLQPGKIITIISNKKHDEYTQVKLDTGKSGWLKTSNVEPIYNR